MREKYHQNSELLLAYLLQSRSMNLADMKSLVMLSVPGLLAVFQSSLMSLFFFSLLPIRNENKT